MFHFNNQIYYAKEYLKNHIKNNIFLKLQDSMKQFANSKQAIICS